MASFLTRRSAIIGAVASATVLALKAHATGLPKTHQIKIKNFVFEPDHINVHVGDTIKWVNEDLAPHTATATEIGWDTGEIAGGESGEIVVLKDMETSYFCAFHPHMKGSIEIV